MSSLLSFGRQSLNNGRYILRSYQVYIRRDAHNNIDAEVEKVKKWWSEPRFKDTKRNHTALDVVRHRGSSYLAENTRYQSSIQADKLHALIQEHFDKKKPLHTLGVIDPVQMTQLAKCPDIKINYVSGWACSSNFVGSTNEVSPDFGDYPYTTVPNQVERIFKAQQLHDKKQCLDNLKSNIDYLKPIIADADMGHGGITAVMKLAKLFAEKGAAAIHIEDQLMGGKRCGHLGGSVVVPTLTHLSRIQAIRFQWDIMNTNNLVIARTDSLNSKLISSTVDPRDHEFVKGIINKSSNIIPLSDQIIKLQSRKECNQNTLSSSSFATLEQEWYDHNKLYTFNEAVQQQVSIEEFKKYEAETSILKKKLGRDYLSITEMKYLIETIAPKKTVKFDWDAPRTIEGYYMFNGCLEAAIKRILNFTPYSDLLWLETKTPDLKEAKYLSKSIHEVYPNTKMVYNLSPSFNWMSNGFTPETLKGFIWDLAKEGYILQLVSLAGIHTDGLAFWELAQKFQSEGMKAYVDLVQQREKKTKCDLLTHQKWSGAEYIDSVMNIVNNGSSLKTQSTSGQAFTETQF